MLSTSCIYTHDWGDAYHYKDGLLHREDGPAITTVAGYKFWFRNGKLHRKDGPAYIGPNGLKEYWIGGVRYDVHQYVEYLAHEIDYLKDDLAGTVSSRNCVNRFLTDEMRKTAQLTRSMQRAKRRAFVVRKQSLFWRGLANRCADIGAALMKEKQKAKTEEPFPMETKTCLRCRKPAVLMPVYSGTTGPYCSNVCAIG